MKKWKKKMLDYLEPNIKSYRENAADIKRKTVTGKKLIEYGWYCGYAEAYEDIAKTVKDWKHRDEEY